MIRFVRLIRLLVFALCCLIPAWGSGQQRGNAVHVLTDGLNDRKLKGDIEAVFQKVNAAAEMNVLAAIRQSLVLLHNAGYLEAGYQDNRDTLKREIKFDQGPPYSWARLKTAEADEDILSGAGVSDRLYRKKVFTPPSYARLCNDILKYCTNNGYPFALVRLDSVVAENGHLSARLVLDRGPLMTVDTLVIRGNARITPAYLRNYLSLKTGEPFNESVFRKISVRIQEIPFLTEGRTPEIEFTKNTARPVLFLQARKASQINGVVGVQPDNAGSGKVFVTGDVRLRLHNSFGKAELLDLNWSNPMPRSQDLKIKFSLPFLFSLPVGVEGDLTLFKKDTIFLEINRQLGFRYFFAGNNSFRLFLGRKTSDLISAKGYENTTTLPSFADVATNTYGLGLQFQRLDYRLNPRRGFAVDFNAGAGVRTITKNPKVNEQVYDSLDLRNTQYKGEVTADFYLPVFKRGVINIGTYAAWMEAENIFSNELYRLGGLRTLRGFDEQSISASSFVLWKAEYRFILEQNSYLLLFYNQAWYEDQSKPQLFSDTPYGYGAGITFETKLGIFSFTYALGSQQGNPVEFRSAKVHFGLINYF
ncbi:MAG: BamA/TamA family outer membrane protein [Bacteroidia bacterium]